MPTPPAPLDGAAEPSSSTEHPSAPRPATRRLPIHGVTLVVFVAGLVLSVVLVWATSAAYERNEDRLLQERVKQAAAVLTAALPGIQTPLASAVEVAEQGDGEQAAFQKLMTRMVENGQPFVSASLWRVDADPPAPVVVVGAPPKLATQPPEAIRTFLDRSASTTGLVVLGLLEGDEPRLGYSYTSDSGSITYVAYAEAALPADRTQAVPSDSAFAGLDFVIYLGDAEVDDAVLTASTDQLPFTGRHHAEAVAFGDSTLLLVMKPTTELGGSLLAMLPWLIGVVGVVSTIGASLLVEQLLRRRDRANALAAQNEELYANQLSVARTLQHSLLPQRLPDIDGLEVSARYVAGVAGLDIGGDWYDVIDLTDGTVMIVVGDVSGRGLEAGTVMASLRFAIRAFASRGEEPAAILTGLTGLLDLAQDRHFATVACAVVSVADRTITVANAGHPSPMVIDSSGAWFLTTAVGPPIGVTHDGHYVTTTHRLEAGSTVIMFTDGVFERRGETVDVGLERLRRSVPEASESLDQTLDGLLRNQITRDASDDSAILGVRWTTPTN